jgi:hypothetical protein
MTLPNPVKSIERRLVDEARGHLLEASGAMRRGEIDPRYTRKMAGYASLLLKSDAPDFLIASTLATLGGNLHAAGVDNPRVRRLANAAIRKAYPPEINPSSDRLNRVEAAALRKAMDTTSRDTPFPTAYDEALVDAGLPPHDVLLADTEFKNADALEELAEQKRVAAKKDSENKEDEPFSDSSSPKIPVS